MLCGGIKEFYRIFVLVIIVLGIAACSSGDGDNNENQEKPSPFITSFTATELTVTIGQTTTITPIYNNGEGVIDNDIGDVASGSSITVNPTSTTTYTLTVNNTNGDSVNQQLTITVVPPPVITSFAASQLTITSGNSVAFTPIFSSGIGTIDNDVGIINSTDIITVSPTTTTTYTLSVVNDAGGIVSRQVTITVVPPPEITSFTASQSTITSGNSATLTPIFSGGEGSIDNGIGVVNSTDRVTVNPTTTTTYSLSVDNGAGGIVTQQIIITVVPPPVITSFTASQSTITSGNNATLTPVFSGGVGTIDNGVGIVNSTDSVTVNPTTTTTYSLTIDNGLGGIVTQQITITVVPLPVITSFTASQSTVTSGNSVTFTPVFSGGEGSIDNGIGVVNSTDRITVNPTTTATYLLSVDNGAGGIVTQQVTITVVPLPVITSFTSDQSTITTGDSTTLTPVFSGGEGAIDNGVGAVNSTDIITVNPTTTTTYTLTVDNGADGVVTQQITITVVLLPEITSFTASQSTITSGNSTTLTPVFSGGEGSIDNGVGVVSSTDIITINPTTTTTYTLTVDNGNGDSTHQQLIITVVPPPVITSFTASQSSIMKGDSVTLTPEFSGGVGTIDNGVGIVNSTDIITVNPTITTTYSLTVDNDLGGILTRQVTIVVGRLLNDTGMTQCYDNTAVVPCPAASFPGQDADRGFDAEANDNSDGFAGFSFTKLDSDGSPLSATATSWSCVRDERTNLTWEVKEALPGSLHSASNTYTWYSTDSTNNSGVPGTMDGGNCSGSLCDTEAFVAAVNSEELCGFNDWRMPDRNELNSIIRIVSSSLDAPVDTQYFPYHGTGSYWSGTSPGWSSTIGINGGDANYLSRLGFGYLPKANKFGVRLVRGNRWNSSDNVNAQYDQTCQIDTVRASTPTTRFIDNDDGTVTDSLTNLSWTRCPRGKTWDKLTNFCTGAANNYTWQQALQEVANLNSSGGINGYTNWRLPNYKELLSISEAQCVAPGINLEVFPIWNANNIYVFWSSTTVMSRPDLAFRMAFYSAFLGSLNKTQSQQILLVRDAY